MEATAEQLWLAQWQEAAVALEEERRRRLAQLTDAEALRDADAVLALAGTAPVSEERGTSSGLVVQQSLFHGLARD